nr:unnamed protein product [Callosobruchus chinensis]
MLQYRERQHQTKQWKNRIRSIYSLVNKLESSLLQSQILEKRMVMAVHLSTLKDNSNKAHLETLENENWKLISMLVGTDDITTQRIAPDSTCSTMSLVHMQYK